MMNTDVKERILIIDDDPKGIAMLTIALQQQQLRIIAADSGALGVELALSEKPDIVLVDVIMPKPDGIDVCRTLKGMSATRSIPVICMTGADDESLKLRCLEAGANDFLAKPVDQAELLLRIRNLLRFKQVARAKDEWEGTMDCIRDLVLLVDADGGIRRCNRAVAGFFDKPYPQILGNNWLEMFKAAGLFIEMAQDAKLEICKHSTGFWYEVALYQGRDDLFLQSTIITIRDITEIKQLTSSLNEQKRQLVLERDRFEALWRLGEMAGAPQNELVDFALESIVSLTGSTGGYLHFLNAGEESIELYAWSRDVRKDCAAAKTPHYPLASAGIWADSVRQRGAVIHNDYPERADRKGLPKGHFPVMRHMSVPIFDGNAIVAIAGVGNKEQEYTQDDVRQVALFITELWRMIKQQRMNVQFMQQEKMASIGQLAAGIAHEINNPLGFILSNLSTLRKYNERIASFIRLQEDTVEKIAAGGSGAGELMRALSAERSSLKIDRIVGDLDSLISESLEGGERVKKIVASMKAFSRASEDESRPADINEGIESTINIVWNEIKYKAEVVRDYGTLPRTVCNLGQLNQVFMNLLVNAAQAIEKQGTIGVRSRAENGSILVSVSDTGCGIPQENLKRVFDPFYTTKEVGKGTGLGLSISYEIVKKHNGTLTVESEKGKGTTFTISIPIVFEKNTDDPQIDQRGVS